MSRDPKQAAEELKIDLNTLVDVCRLERIFTNAKALADAQLARVDSGDKEPEDSPADATWLREISAYKDGVFYFPKSASGPITVLRFEVPGTLRIKSGTFEVSLPTEPLTKLGVLRVLDFFGTLSADDLVRQTQALRGSKVAEKNELEALREENRKLLRALAVAEKNVKTAEENFERIYQAVLATAGVSDTDYGRYGYLPALELIKKKMEEGGPQWQPAPGPGKSWPSLFLAILRNGNIELSVGVGGPVAAGPGQVILRHQGVVSSTEITQILPIPLPKHTQGKR